MGPKASGAFAVGSVSCWSVRVWLAALSIRSIAELLAIGLALEFFFFFLLFGQFFLTLFVTVIRCCQDVLSV